jgi:hypothetical protein
MGRFFQTAEPQFLQDFIYKPPYEMLLAGLQKEQGDYNTALATANMYNNIDVNYIDDEKERERVRQIQDKWGNRTEELSRNIREADDWKKFMPELNKMSKELHQDYTTGELYTVQKSAENYAKMNEELAKIKDPAIKEKAKQVFMDRWREKDRPVFESENIFDRRDLVAEYLKTKSKGEADKIAKAWANPGGGYIRSGEFTEEFINDTKKDFDNWLKQPENLAYMKQQDELLGLETYFDKDTGELISPDDPRSSAYHSKQHAISVADFNKQNRKADIGADGAYQFERQLAESRKAAQADYNSVDTDAAPAIVSNKFLHVNTALQNELFNNITNQLKSVGQNKIGLTPKNLLATIKKIKEDPKYLPKARGVIMDVYNQMNVNSKTTKQHFYDTVGDKAKADSYLKNVENVWKDNHKFYIGYDGNNVSAGQEGTVSKNRLSLNQIKNTINKYGSFKIGNKNITDIELEEEVLPTMVDRNNLGNNYYTRFATATYKEGDVEQIVTFPVHVPVNEYLKF